MPDEHLHERKELAWTIELARPEDAAAIIRDVTVRSWLATYPNDACGVSLEDVTATVTSDLDERVREWEDFLERARTSERAHVWVARSSDKDVVGFCLARKYEQSTSIDRLYLLPEWRSKGLGSRLMEEALAWADTSKPVHLDVAAYNANAIRFYQRYGFEEKGATPAPQAIRLASGNVLPMIRMEKTR